MDKAFLAEHTYILACNLWFCARQSSMTIVKYNTRVVSTIVSKIFKLANTEIFMFAYGISTIFENDSYTAGLVTALFLYRSM